MNCFRCSKQASSLCPSCCKPLCLQHSEEMVFKDPTQSGCYGQREFDNFAVATMMEIINENNKV